MPLSEAAAISGFTRQHLALLARTGKMRVGPYWLTRRAVVEEYLEDGFSRSKDPFS